MILTPEQIIIPEEKILNYLLVSKEKNDKSGFFPGWDSAEIITTN